MHCRFPLPVLMLVAWALFASPVGAEDDKNSSLNREAFQILNRHCYQCHGPKKISGIDIRSAQGLEEHLVPGDLENSNLWTVLSEDTMPKGNIKLNRKEMKIIREWILSGAVFPEQASRPFVSELDIVKAIQFDLSQISPNDTNHQRYLSLAHLHNNPRVTEWDLRLYRAAFSKLINSLNRKLPRIVVPEAIDANHTVYRIDLRDYGISRDHYNTLLNTYPYGLIYSDSKVRNARKSIDKQFGPAAANKFTYIRVDWFVAKAARPLADGSHDFYKLFLDLPDTVAELEKGLSVDAERNFLRGKAGVDIARAAFSESAISVANRLLERHQSRDGYYWKSFDFKKSSGVSNLFQRPLGPVFEKNPFDNAFQFQHDGGEMIYRMPNGLQGYYLTDSQGNYITEGPIQVVRDKDEVSGTPVVVNGLSCITCHEWGTKAFKDAVRTGFQGGNIDALEKVQELFIEPEEMEKFWQSDREQFKRALTKTTGEFLLVKEDKSKDIFDFVEPVKALVLHYKEDVSLEDAAAELGYPTERIPELKGSFRIRVAKTLGLGPLANGRTIKREVWEAQFQGGSLWQKAAELISLGEREN